LDRVGKKMSRSDTKEKKQGKEKTSRKSKSANGFDRESWMGGGSG